MELSEDNLKLLRQVKDQFMKQLLCNAIAWEPRQMAQLIVLVKYTFKYNDETKFKSLLLSCNVLNVHVAAALHDLGVTFLDTETIFLCLQSLAKTDGAFIKLYSEALSLSLIEVQDDATIWKLKEISSAFTKKNVVKLLRTSCEYADNYKRMGEILREYCYSLDREEASSYISKVFSYLKEFEPKGSPQTFLKALEEGEKGIIVSEAENIVIQKYITRYDKGAKYKLYKQRNKRKRKIHQTSPGSDLVGDGKVHKIKKEEMKDYDDDEDEEDEEGSDEDEEGSDEDEEGSDEDEVSFEDEEESDEDEDEEESDEDEDESDEGSFEDEEESDEDEDESDEKGEMKTKKKVTKMKTRARK